MITSQRAEPVSSAAATRLVKNVARLILDAGFMGKLLHGVPGTTSGIGEPILPICGGVS